LLSVFLLIQFIMIHFFLFILFSQFHIPISHLHACFDYQFTYLILLELGPWGFNFNFVFMLFQCWLDDKSLFRFFFSHSNSSLLTLNLIWFVSVLHFVADRVFSPNWMRFWQESFPRMVILGKWLFLVNCFINPPILITWIESDLRWW
jgi:hypothetical protein